MTMPDPHVLFDEKAIAARVRELGKEITETCRAEQPLTVIPIMNGSIFFASDLIRAINLPMHIDIFAASSYEEDHSTGSLNIRAELKLEIKDRYVLVIDDILDTGFTLMKTVEHFLALGAAGVRTCVLLDKVLPEGKQKMFAADWSGFRIPAKFVVGYGLDYDEDYRTLPYIGYFE